MKNSETSVNGIGSEKGITARQQLFIDEYLKDPNGMKAAERAGYKVPATAAAQLLDGVTHPKVARLVKEALAEKRKACGIEAVRVVEELGKIAFFNIKGLFNDKGEMLPVHQLPDDVACCVKGFTVSQRSGKGVKGEDIKIRTVDVKLHDKLDALRQISQHLGFLKEVINNQVNNTTVVVDWSSMHQRRQVVDVVDQKIAEQEGRSNMLGLPSPPTLTSSEEE